VEHVELDFNVLMESVYQILETHAHQLQNAQIPLNLKHLLALMVQVSQRVDLSPMDAAAPSTVDLAPVANSVINLVVTILALQELPHVHPTPVVLLVMDVEVF